MLVHYGGICLYEECVWDEVGDEITIEGRNAQIWHDATEDHFMQSPTIAKSHCTTCYACYQCYIYTATGGLVQRLGTPFIN